MHGWCVLDTHPICIRNAHLNFSNDAHLDAFHMRIKNASMIPTLTLIQLIQDMRFQCISDAHQKCWNALMQCLKRFKCVSCSLGTLSLDPPLRHWIFCPLLTVCLCMTIRPCLVFACLSGKGNASSLHFCCILSYLLFPAQICYQNVLFLEKVL